MKALTVFTSSALAAAALVALAPEAAASIKNPNDHPDYRVELEPHGTAIFWRYRYAGYYHRGRGARYFGDPEFGAGFRASIELADPAFIPKLNNTVAISFGVDLTNCRFCDVRYDFWIWTPVTLQWNFFFNEHWSAFGDIGFILRAGGFYRDVYPDLAFMLGGRYHFNDTVALTMRIGVPFITFGVSFFVGS
jgi:hypothetical protein